MQKEDRYAVVRIKDDIETYQAQQIACSEGTLHPVFIYTMCVIDLLSYKFGIRKTQAGSF